MSSQPDYIKPNAKPLTDDELAQALTENVCAFPRVVRDMRDPPISNQSFANVSLMLFKEPRQFKSGKPVSGFMKIRGVWPTESTASADASRIIKEVDSKYPIRIAPVGAWLPITEETDFVKESIDVRMKDEETHLRDEAVREKNAERRKVMRELREREEELQGEEDVYAHRDTLAYYTMKRWTEVTLSETIERKQQELAKMEATRKGVWRELRELEVDNPQYTGMWIEYFNDKRQEVSIPEWKPSATQFEGYDATTLDGLVAEGVESSAPAEFRAYKE